MDVVRGLGALPRGLRVCVTVGVFDGLHRGHQALLGALVRTARQAVARPMVVTFEPHPDQVLRGAAPTHLADPAEAVERLAALGVATTVVERFDEALRELTAEEFLARVADGRALTGVVMASGSAFGRNRGGTPAALRALGAAAGWSVVEVPTVELRGGPVSSARIRALLEAGRLAEARALLGRRYALVGEVVHGHGRGRALGFPTANLAFESPVCLPPDGIYAVRATWGGPSPLRPADRADAVASLGTQPTFDGHDRVLEVHLLDRDVDLYGARLRVELVRRLRGQRRFRDVAGLVAQMGLDVERTRRVLGAVAD
jgi:riboflavin kinase / FMN adenylyltransferase